MSRYHTTSPSGEQIFKAAIVMESEAREALFLQLSRTALALQQRPELLARISSYWEGKTDAEAKETGETEEELTRSFFAFLSNGRE